jgi:outer membrane immunogenic protein
MKKSLIPAIAIALALAAGSAFAADLPSRKEAPVYVPPPPPPPMWTGFYFGANIGGGWKANSGNTNTLVPYTDTAIGGVFLLPGGGSTTNNSGGVVGGGQIGYNFQFGSMIVVGAEADIQGTSIGSGGNNNTVTVFPSPNVPGAFLVPIATGNNVGTSIPWFGTVRGRAGFLVTPTLLVYGTGGFAYGGVQGNVSGFSNTRTGWTAGGGVEWLFMPNWSAKAEYLYVDLDSGGNTGTFGFQFGTHRHPQMNVVRAGVNYHFNFGPTAPVLAKY